MNEEGKITEQQMLDTLKKSGYVLEVEVADILCEKGFFVQKSAVIQDQLTAKSREIDIVAEYYNSDDYQRNHLSHQKYRVLAKIHFVFEIKNNPYPVVLLNEHTSSPNGIEDFLGIKDIIRVPEEISKSIEHNYYYDIFFENRRNIFSQYCSFTEKNRSQGSQKSKSRGGQQNQPQSGQNSLEFMAHHPDYIHESLLKIIQYCDEQQGLDESGENVSVWNLPYYQHLLYMPILLINDDLYELIEGKLKKVDSSVLVVNYHDKFRPNMSFIFVVTKNGLNDFIDAALKIQSNVQLKMEKKIKLIPCFIIL